MTHSPGPWSADLKHQCKIVGAWKSKNGGGCTVTLKTLEVLDNNTIGTIAIVNCESSPPSKEDKANAILIAAAPDMLEALKSLASTARTFRNVPDENKTWTSLDEDTLTAAFKTINKATGVKQ